MSNIVVTKKRHNTYIDIKLMKNEVANKREVDILSNNIYDEFLKIVRIKKNNTDIRYDITNLIPLCDYLKIVINKSSFVHLCLSIIDVLKVTTGRTMYNKNIVMSTDKIYVNPTNKQLKFLYLPITNYNATLDIQNFFKKLPYEAIFNQHEDCDYVKEYIKYFKDSINFSLYEFEKMLEEMIKKESAVPVVAHTSKMLDGINNKENAKFFNRSNNSENRTNFYEIEEEGTVVLDDESEGTTTLEESVTTLKIYPRLLRKRTGEIIKINKLEFSVGKGKTADFSIDNNTAVSRVHAKIYTRGGRFFIQDNNSTNGTFVDNERLEPGTETEISSGQIIKLADEEFECM